jgi:imidazolonepropionase-like amidohydrolase
MRDRRRRRLSAWAGALIFLVSGSRLAGAQDHICLQPSGALATNSRGGVSATLLPPPPAVGRYAFTNVTVLPMDSDRVLPAQTVLVDGGRIAAIGPGRTLRVPADAVVIEGDGRWLMPGLVDAHTHERALPDWPDDVAGNLVMYLANGVTSIFNMGDFTGDMIGARDAVKAGSLAGPTIYVGHFVRGPSDGGTESTTVTGAQAARDLVRRAKAEGYDFLKVYDGVPAAAYDALVAEGEAAGLPVTGHGIRALGLPYTLTHGQVMVAHASYFSALFPTAAEGDVSSVSRMVASSGVAVTATLFVQELIAGLGLDALAGRDPWTRVITQEGVEYMDERALEAWVRMFRFRADIRAPGDARPELAFMQRYTKAFADAGVPILAGADTIGIPGVVPGFSLHGEIRLLQAAGLTPEQTLAAATRNPGAFARRHLRSAEPFGVVEAGARADLLLLDSDPRDDLSVLRRASGVMAGGRWYPRESLSAQLDLLRRSR